uniref:TACC_C domain-containing protein n=1 Tax=Elaeophora elaphi TaxID=1147741 RepID=A0A0R3RKW6_9BILA
MIEKNIADTDNSNNTITVTKPTDNTDNITKLCLEPIRKNKESNPENVTVYIHDIETYDNLNTFPISSSPADEEQSVQELNNLKLNLKCNRKVPDNEKHQSLPYTLISSFEEKDNQQSTIKNYLMLPKRHTKLTPVSSSSDSAETTSPVSPFASTSITFQYPDLKKQEAAYDALISRNIDQAKISESLYENQEVRNANSATTDCINECETLTDFTDQIEIQQALKQLDDALDEQIPIETFQSLNSGKCNMETTEGKTESTSKKSVKQLVEMLDSKQLQFGRWNELSKLHPTVSNQDSDLTSDCDSNTEMKAPSCAFDHPPETSAKPSLIGVSIFGLNDGKSIAEIIAEKKNPKNRSLHKRPPTSPKPVLKKPLPIPKLPTLDEDEQQKWLDHPSSSTQAIHSSFGKPICDNRRENMIVTIEKKPIIRTRHQKVSNSEMLPTIIKVEDSESFVNYPQAAIDIASSSVASMVIDTTRKDSGQQCPCEGQHVIVNHIYENLNQNGNDQYLETSFDGPIAMTVISESKNGTTKDLDASHIFHQHQQQRWEDSVADKGKLFIDNTSTVISVSSNDACNYVNDVKWRSDPEKRTNFDVSLENDRNSEPIPPPRTFLKHCSYDSVPDKRMMQRSTSMYYSSNSNESNDTATNFSANTVQQHPSIINRSSSLSIPETARVPVRPKPAPRRIDCMKRTTITVDVPEVMKFS